MKFFAESANAPASRRGFLKPAARKGFAVLTLIIAMVILWQRSATADDVLPTHAQPKLPTMKIYLGAETLDAELALTQQQEMTGMMFRTNILETDAMLFVLPQPMHASFWMKNCPESISAAYISPDGVIEEIHHLEKNDTTPVVATNDSIQFVLETKDGWFARHNIGIGSIIHTEKGSLADTFLKGRLGPAGKENKNEIPH
jgi:uncharacterized membrane protein (UPF0127 family)